MLRTDRDPAKAEAMQQIADRAFGQRYPEFPLDFGRQVDAPPANHPIFGEVRAGPHPLPQHCRLCRRQLPTGAGRSSVRQTRQPFCVVAVHPIAQGLPVHTATLRSLFARTAVKHQRQRQHPPGRRGILTPRRRPPQPRCIQIRPGDRYRAHLDPHICSQADRIRQHLGLQAPPSQNLPPLVLHLRHEKGFSRRPRDVADSVPRSSAWPTRCGPSCWPDLPLA